MKGITVTELHTQDGWDWPNGCADERWPVEAPEAEPRRAPTPQTGDIITIDQADTRRWTRFCCWLTRRPLPMHRVPLRVHGVMLSDGWYGWPWQE